jgi:hypothetical protein
LITLVAVAVLAVALSACGSSSGGSTSEHAEVKTAKIPKPVASEPEEGSTEESGGSAELKSIIRLQIYGRWGGTPTEFEVAGGSCKIDKINTSKAALKADGGAVLNHEHNASVLVTPIKRGDKSPTAAECREAVATAIG